MDDFHWRKLKCDIRDRLESHWKDADIRMGACEEFASALVCALASGEFELALGARSCGTWSDDQRSVLDLVACVAVSTVARARGIDALPASKVLELDPPAGSVIEDVLLGRAIDESSPEKDPLLHVWKDVEER